jgi:hypothetical protein
MSDDDDPAERYMHLVDRIARADPRLTQLAAGILAASMLDIAHDSVAFCRLLDVSHALVLREVDALEHDLGLIAVEKRDARTQRCFYAPTSAASALHTM